MNDPTTKSRIDGCTVKKMHTTQMMTFVRKSDLSGFLPRPNFAMIAPPNIRESAVQVGLMHDWSKRLTKDRNAFTDAESADAENYARAQLGKYDPDGLLFDATEPHGLERLETADATMAEHCVHLIDLSCMPEGIVPPEKRIDDIVRRRKAEGVDHEKDYPDF